MARPTLIFLLFSLFLIFFQGQTLADQVWSTKQLHILKSLWVGSMTDLPKDPSNKFSDDPTAVSLGHRIFFDKRFSGEGTVACASCHQPLRAFTDGLPLAIGIGQVIRNTPTIIGTAYSPWFFWDGRADSQWSQALQPMEASTEHGGTRTGFAKIIYGVSSYRRSYEKLFGAMPDISDDNRFPAQAAPIKIALARSAWENMATEDQKIITRIFVNISKAIAAYERLILPGPSRFDNYVGKLLKGKNVRDDQTLTDDEIAGLRLFIGRGACTQCHNGPLLTNNGFHNIGLSIDEVSESDEGRTRGALSVKQSEFNCAGPYSDAENKDCAELDFIKLTGVGLLGSFKTPTLRNLKKTAPYMHDGQFATLDDVLNHYNQAPEAMIGKSDVLPLEFTTKQLDQMRYFLLSLDSSINVDPRYLSAP
jgi:cytochrome c peroxidase